MLFMHSLTTLLSLRVADLVSGTAWSASDWHWRLSRDAVSNLSPNTKVYSFIHTFMRPLIEQVFSNDLLSIRTQDDAFHTFRREMLITEALIDALPGQREFNTEIQSVFNDLFGPNL